MEEKRIKFNKLSIKNFRNINELEIDFKNNVTEILAENGKGKTNTLSSIMWCLFGKDINDNKQFPISPIINGVEDNNILTVVKLVINDNFIIERSYHKRKTELKTGFIIDGKEEVVTTSQFKYIEELKNNFVDEETFKSLSNINYIPNLHWSDLKQLIFDLIGDISDNEVLLKGEFEGIEEYVTKFGIDDTKALLQKTDKELNEDIKRLETEYQTLINMKEKYVGEEKDNEILIKRKEEIENELANIESKNNHIKIQNEEIRQKRIEESKNKDEFSKLQSLKEYIIRQISDYSNLYNQNSYNIEGARNKDKIEVETKITNCKYELQNRESRLSFLKIDLTKVQEEGIALKDKVIKIEKDKCNSCGQILPEELIKETLAKLELEHKEKLDDTRDKFLQLQKEVKMHEEDILSIKQNIVELEKELALIDSKVYENIEETDKQKEIRIIKEQKELELKDIETNINNFEHIEYDLPIELELLTYDLTELNEINSKLSTTIALAKITEDIEKTNKELENKRETKIITHEKMQLVIKFNNFKASLLQEKVRMYFNIVNFKVKETTLQGDEVECFKICDEKGVEFKEINTAHKILLGIDLLTGIMKAKNIYVPIIIDNVECITSDLNINNTQLIIAKAVRNISGLEVR